MEDMQLRMRIAGTAVAALALFLSACGGDATETPAPGEQETVTQTTEPAEEATEDSTDETAGETPAEESDDDEAPVGFPFEEGPVDPPAFKALYEPAMSSVEFFTQTMEMEGTTSITYVENTSPDNPSAYSITEADGMKMETVVRDGKTWARIDEGEWEEMGEVGDDIGADALESEFSEVELVDAAQRQFRVVMDLAGQGQEALLTVDEQFRAAVLEMEIADRTAVTTFDYETRMEIPEVG